MKNMKEIKWEMHFYTSDNLIRVYPNTIYVGDTRFQGIGEWDWKEWIKKERKNQEEKLKLVEIAFTKWEKEFKKHE